MFSVLFSILVSVSFAQNQNAVDFVSPQGSAKSVSQIHIRFRQPMIRLGELSFQAPAQSSCFKNGSGRWVDTRNWVYDLNEPMPGGLKCQIKVGNQNFEFNTGGALIRSVFPPGYREIQPDQSFVLVLDSKVNDRSVEQNAYFSAENLGDRLPVQVVRGSERERVIKAAQEEFKYDGDAFKGDLLVIRSSRKFPAGLALNLIWPKSVQSESGQISENPQSFEFKVKPAFTASFSCDREAPGKPCIPLGQFRLSFSAPIETALAKQVYISVGDKRIFASNLNEEPQDNTVSYLTFAGPFAPNTKMQLILPKNVKNEDKESLTNQNQFPLPIETGDYPVLLKFASNFGLIEALPDAALAVTMRYVEKSVETRFEGTHQKMGPQFFPMIVERLKQSEYDVVGEKSLPAIKGLPSKKIEITKPRDPKDTEVVGIPLKEKGFYFVEMKSPKLGESLNADKNPMYVRSTVLVTNMVAHVKSSKENILVWVTQLSNTQPIAEATVHLTDDKGKTLLSGKTNAQGLVVLKGSAVGDKEFFVLAEKDDDFTFTRSNWTNGIESWRYQLYQGERSGTFIGHAVMDRTLFRPEETLSAKIVLRKTNLKGLSIPVANDRVKEVILTHDSGAQIFKVPLRWDAKNGTADIQWKIPQGALLGRWALSLEKVGQGGYVLDIGDFRVENFRIPLLKAQIASESSQLILDKNPKFDVGAEYLAGGAATKLPMSLRWSVEPYYLDIRDDEYQDYQWMNGKVKEGLFRTGDESFQSHIPQSGKQAFTLDEKGAGRIQIKDLKYTQSPQKLYTELEFKDPNGEIQNIGRSFVLWNADRLVGIRAKSWWAQKNAVDFDVAVLNLQQEPISNADVKVELYTSRYISHRKRLVGGFYAYESFQEIKKIGDLCQGKTNSKGIFQCVGKSNFAGSVVAVVSTKDSKGRVALAQTQQWIVGDTTEQWFGSQDNDRADLIAMRRFYEPGEKAQFQLRTPFKSSRVLVTIEREGVIESKIIDVKSENPSFELPIKPEYAPNVVVSAFAIRGRLDTPQATALLDLAKPAFKMGMTEIKVGWGSHRLNVKVSTDKKIYQVRDKVKAKIVVKDAKGRPVRGGEVVIAAVDEGLLELRNNSSWDILSVMMAPHAHGVSTATAQTFVIGRRHFGLKALPVGGDGRGGSLRELFDTLLYWNPSVKLNNKGEATVEVPLNDSLSSFRIVAVALQGTDRFGTGWNTIQSSRDLMIFAGLPGLVRQGDEMAMEYTIRNTSSIIQDIQVNLSTTPAIAGLNTEKLRLNPQESRTLQWKVKIPENVTSLDYVIQARNSGGKVLDQVKKTQAVVPVFRPAVYQSEMGQWPDFKEINVAVPAGAVSGKTSAQVDVSSSLLSNLSGLKEFWNDYTYTCLEQQVSKAISLQDKKLWSQLDGKWSIYLDNKGLLKFFPESPYGSTALTSYVLSLAQEAKWDIEEASRMRMLEALSDFVEGRLKSDEPSRGDETLRKISALEALSRYGRFNASMVTALNFDLDQWPTYSLVEWADILRREKEVAGRDEKLKQVNGILRSRMYFSAKRLRFKEEQRDQMFWLMRNSDLAAVRMVLSSMDDKDWKKDIPGMTLGAIDRQTKGSWMLTTANAWGSLMLRKFAATYEKEKPQGIFVVQASEESKTHSWAKGSEQSFDFPVNGTSSKVQWKQDGVGRPWVTASIKAAIPLKEPLSAGYAVEKTLIPVEQKKSGVWSRGDVIKVQIKVRSQAPMSWVVLNDPLPAGASVLGGGLQRDSQLLTQNNVNDLWSDSIERAQDSVRFYYSWFPQGQFTIEYTLRLNQSGVFQLPQTRVEAMYSPDLFGEKPNAVMKVID